MANKVSQKVFQKIDGEKVQMKPKCYFTACSLAWMAGGALVFFLAVLLFVELFFSLSVLKPIAFLRYRSLWDLFFFFHLLPWLVAGALVYLAARLYRQSRKVCRHEEWMLLVFLSSVALLSGIIFSVAGKKLLDEKDLTAVNLAIKYWSLPQQGTFSGKVNRVKSSVRLEVCDWKGHIWEVDVSRCHCPDIQTNPHGVIKLVGQTTALNEFEAWEGWFWEQ